MTSPSPAEHRREVLDGLARRYVWWRDPGGPDDDVIIAQVMNLGTWDDIQRLEAVLTVTDLRDAMLKARAGWISPPSWSFWRGRLMAEGCADIPDTPPKRAFHADLL